LLTRRPGDRQDRREGPEDCRPQVESPKTTKRCERTSDRITLDETPDRNLTIPDYRKCSSLKT
jgi:hypothetical protein